MNKIAFALMLISSLCLWSCSGDDDDNSNVPYQANDIELSITAARSTSDMYTIEFTTEILNFDQINRNLYTFYCYISTEPINDFSQYAPDYAHIESTAPESGWAYQTLSFYSTSKETGKWKLKSIYTTNTYYIYVYAHRLNDDGTTAYDNKALVTFDDINPQDLIKKFWVEDVSSVWKRSMEFKSCGDYYDRTFGSGNSVTLNASGTYTIRTDGDKNSIRVVTTEGKQYDYTVEALSATSMTLSGGNLTSTIKFEYEDCTNEAYVEFVDLGLPSGTLWADRNVGAFTPEEAGNYYCWSSVEEANTKNKSTSSFSADYSGTNLQGTAYDAATVYCSSWMMPTIDQFYELKANCTYDSSTNTYTGTNGNSITLQGYYWSATKYDSYHAQYFYENSTSYRYMEYSYHIRPVK